MQSSGGTQTYTNNSPPTFSAHASCSSSQTTTSSVRGAHFLSLSHIPSTPCRCRGMSAQSQHDNDPLTLPPPIVEAPDALYPNAHPTKVRFWLSFPSPLLTRAILAPHTRSGAGAVPRLVAGRRRPGPSRAPRIVHLVSGPLLLWHSITIRFPRPTFDPCERHPRDPHTQ